MGKIYTYREHGTNQRITSDKPLKGSENGNDVTLLSEATIPDAPAPEAAPAPADEKK